MIYLSFQQKIIILIGIISVFLMLFFLSRSLYYSYLIDQQIIRLEKQNVGLLGKIDNTKYNIAYYDSVNYKDKYAKEMLNVLNEGEKMLVFTESMMADNADKNVKNNNLLNKKTPPMAWQEYFNFYRQLKNSN